MPRLHPDDLAELGRAIAGELKEDLRLINTKEGVAKDMMTFSIKEAAKILSKDTTTIYRWCNKGILKATRSGKSWRITQQTLNDHINGNNKQ